MTFDLVELTATQSISTNAARWIFASFAIAFAVKVPMFPVHTWLPDAHTDAPTAGSVILAACSSLGAYGLIRFGLELFPEAAHWATPVNDVGGDRHRSTAPSSPRCRPTWKRLGGVLVGGPHGLHLPSASSPSRSSGSTAVCCRC
ncbi:MAG: proton-conducting transporter membrane subunit [Microthrixaceae bacterium]